MATDPPSTPLATAQRTAMLPPPPPPSTNGARPTSVNGSSRSRRPSATNGERPQKRVRISEDYVPTITTQAMTDLGTSLEVDHMILDYLVYQAINTCFACQNVPRLEKDLSPVERSLLQVDEFVHLFQHRYPRFRPDPEMRYRQQLLQLVTLVTQRLVQTSITPPRTSPKALRAQSQARAREWIGDASHIPSAEHDVSAFDLELPLHARRLDDNRARALEELDAPAEDHNYEDAFFGTSACVSLLDMLPLFMRVSASCQILFDENSPSPQWMHLAADWMRQACLEQYLICGREGSDAIDEAFAWGYRDGETSREFKKQRPDSPFELHCEDEDVELWRKIRQRALASLFPKKGKNGELDSSLVWHLGAVALTNPVAKLQEDIIGFLRNAAEVIKKPVLAQLETGQLDGMSEEETQRFLRECGLDVARFYAHNASANQMDTT